eukprot:gb/GECH01010148.1/.p1 GENE.gb/GECH01010148.1/~~gb/GECH01010148.1/.p1  ORF type:complete len:522 (+),score=103.64 gb/GECH01010148.1/:1-1566(+)
MSQEPKPDTDKKSLLKTEEQIANEEKKFILFQYPKSVWFIMGNELCERFSFYGFKTILALYLNNYLLFSEDHATTIVHIFIFFAYGFPLLGGWLSDSYLGKFWTIFSLSLVYCVGNIVISITSIPGVTGTPPHWWGAFLGLFLAAIGTGGIKPCVSSFGGDQFEPHQARLMTSFFSMFYMSINIGSTVSTFITPSIRESFGYPYAFGLPAILLIVATIIFIVGKPAYRINPPGENVFKVFYSVIKDGIVKKFKSNQEPVEHWIDRAKEKHPSGKVEDVKAALSVIKCLTPLIIFWSLFDQHASRWVFQAERMDRKLGLLELTSDQVTVLNPLFIITFVPMFDRLLYPLCRKFGVEPLPLRRISVGFVFTSLAFICSAVLEFFVVAFPHRVSVFLQIPQYMLLAWGEVMVSVTGLEFAYSQAPESMKSIMQAFYLLTTALGNVIVATVAEVSVLPQSAEFFFFAVLMLLGLGIFLLLVRNYQYLPGTYVEKEVPVQTSSPPYSEPSSPEPSSPEHEKDEKLE